MHEPAPALLGLGLAVLGLASCSGSGVFECHQANQCSFGGRVGTCEPDGHCSFPDESCPSGQRYGELSPTALAGMCVPVQGSTGSTEVPATMDGGTGAFEGSGTGVASTGSPLTHDGTTVDVTATLDASDATISGTSSGTTASTTASTSTEGTETGSPVTVLSYPATLAECNDPVYLDPNACESSGSPSMGAMVVDLVDVDAGPIHSFLRFDLDDALVPDDVVSVSLRLVVTSSSNGPSSGEVYRVEPFELMDLFSLQPATMGPLLAPAQGPLSPGDVVEWALPPDVLSLGEPSLYLGILPLSTDGIDYWNLDGAEPPALIIEQQG